MFLQTEPESRFSCALAVLSSVGQAAPSQRGQTKPCGVHQPFSLPLPLAGPLGSLWTRSGGSLPHLLAPRSSLPELCLCSPNPVHRPLPSSVLWLSFSGTLKLSHLHFGWHGGALSPTFFLRSSSPLASYKQCSKGSPERTGRPGTCPPPTSWVHLAPESCYVEGSTIQRALALDVGSVPAVSPTAPLPLALGGQWNFMEEER